MDVWQGDARRDLVRGLVAHDVVEMHFIFPRKFRSGLLSPVYIDCRKIQAHPSLRKKLIHSFSWLWGGIEEAFDAVAGIQNAAIPHSMGVALQAGLPHLSIRKEMKGHGVTCEIEGDYDLRGKHILLLEDVITTGGSVRHGVSVLKVAGAKVAVAAITCYFPDALVTLGLAREDVVVLASFEALIDEMQEQGKLTKRERVRIAEWREDPMGWTKRYTEKHGG